MFSIIVRRMRMGLVPVLVCGAVACATPHKTAEQRQADAATVEQVQAALSADRTLYARHITVYADNGVVTLSGYVWTPEELAMAREDVEAVPGVTKVVNRIEVDRGAINNSSVTR